MGIAVLRAMTLTMHRRRVHPSIATAVAEAYLVGGLTRLAGLAGVLLESTEAAEALEATQAPAE
jgi:hypothetical protein